MIDVNWFVLGPAVTVEMGAWRHEITKRGLGVPRDGVEIVSAGKYVLALIVRPELTNAAENVFTWRSSLEPFITLALITSVIIQKCIEK